MRKVDRLAGIMVVVFVFAAPSPGQHRSAADDFDSALSRMQNNVYREGLFEAFGHDHLVTAKEFSGRVIFDANCPKNSSVTFRVATKSLTPLDPGESEERSSVQETMQGKKYSMSSGSRT